MSVEKPKHIEEFNTLVGLIFAQLHAEFPLAYDLDEAALARAMGLLEGLDPVVDPNYLPANLELPSKRRCEESARRHPGSGCTGRASSARTATGRTALSS